MDRKEMRDIYYDPKQFRGGRARDRSVARATVSRMQVDVIAGFKLGLGLGGVVAMAVLAVWWWFF